MFAEINVQLLEPNVLYLDEKPPKIVKSKRAKRRGTKRKLAKKKAAIMQKTKVKQIKKIAAIKTELQSTSAGTTKDLKGTGDDPLYTSDREIKMETDIVHKKEEEVVEEGPEDEMDNKPLELQTALAEIKYSDNEEETNMNEEGNMIEEGKEGVCGTKSEQLEEEEFFDYDDDEEEYMDSNEDSEELYDEDDEPLIMLTKRKGRPRKYPLKEEDKRKIPRMEQCREICKQRCTQKFTQDQRRKMCDLFWSLSEEDKKQYIRKRTKTKRYTRLKRKNTKTRGNNCCYYLDNVDDQEEEKEKGQNVAGNFIRVCRKYFESTLCITNYTIKKALDGYEPELEMDIKPLIDQYHHAGSEKKPKEKSDTIQQYLDPETGDLITIDPKAEKLKKALLQPKKKRVRRKPGDPLPEHFPKPIKCAERCIHKCHTKFTEEERKQICDIFWSMDYKRRKDFILARIETKDVETQTTPEFRKSNRPPRAYHTRFFLRSGLQGENKRVCKHFMMATLAINRNFITNAIDFADKTTGYYTGVDRRGQNAAPNKIGPDRKQTITDHISSYPTWIPNKKSKSRYLHHSLNIKRMFLEYKEMCVAQEKKFVSIHYYYRSFHEDFRLSFLSNPEPKRGGGFMKLNPNVSHYTGEEPGGMWLDPKGEKLDLSLHHPAQSFIDYPQQQQQQHAPVVPSLAATNSVVSIGTGPIVAIPAASVSSSNADDSADITVLQPSPLAQTSTSFGFNQPLSYAHIIDPAINSNLICQAPQVVRHEFNPNLYDIHNLPHAHAASTSSLFRKL